MRGGGIGATLEAFPIPLGSVDILPNAPSSAAFGRPSVPTAADPECPTAAEPPPPRANEAAVVAKTRNNAMANFVVVFDMGSSVHYRPPNVEADVGPQFTDTIKFCFRQGNFWRRNEEFTGLRAANAPLSAYACRLAMKRRAVASYLACVVVNRDLEAFMGVASRLFSVLVIAHLSGIMAHGLRRGLKNTLEFDASHKDRPWRS
jgi:hypothetical protein